MNDEQKNARGLIEQGQRATPGLLPDFTELSRAVEKTEAALSHLADETERATGLLKKWNQENAVELVKGTIEETPE